ncbi:MAG: acyl-protein synthetase [Hirschia sp.]|nr:acyl-protein synthetase [Hirschia sp.]MBF19805.1 acyl-protein synthetase [Hirschia sp.]
MVTVPKFQEQTGHFDHASEVADLLAVAPYELDKGQKGPVFDRITQGLTRHHAANCTEYANMLRLLKFDADEEHALEDVPFLPARLFKLLDLKSVAPDAVHRVLTSSGTGGQPSRISLDAPTAALQTRVLTRIVGDFLGKSRLPMLVIDAPSTIRDRTRFNARAAGIMGFSMFGRNITYALNDDMSLDVDGVVAFLERHGQAPFFMFGFTFMVYQHLLGAGAGRVRGLENGILIHGGGWKKLVDLAIDNEAFKQRLKDETGLGRVHNYYGLVEQTGSIFMECEAGHMHCSNFSDVMIRDADFQLCPNGERGLIELVSLLPGSYPGHVLLTEDEGAVIGEDDCSCGRKGKYFQVYGRVAKAEVRGCSDAYASAS